MAGPEASTTGRIFISYRREETAYAAGWLFDRLAEHFGQGQIFKDVDSIMLGDDFVDTINKAVASCDVLLALIGDEWLSTAEPDGRPRIHSPQDFVRLEIEAALSRGIRVIPILVDGATMPRAEDLPNSLSRLPRRHALELSATRFETDTARLLPVLEAALADARGGTGTTDRPTAGTRDATGGTDRPTGATDGPTGGSGKTDGATGTAVDPSRRRALVAAGAAAVAVVLVAGIVVMVSGGSDDVAVREPADAPIPESRCGHRLVEECVDLADPAKYGPALAAADGKLLLAFGAAKPKSDLNVLVSGDGARVEDRYQVVTGEIPDFSDATPALVTAGGRAYLAWAGTDDVGTLNVMVADLGSASPAARPFLDRKTVLYGRTSDLAPALAWHGGGLVLAWTASDGRLWATTSADGAKFSEPVAIAGPTTRAAPSLASHGGRLYLGWIADGGTAYVAALDERMQVAGTGGIVARRLPAQRDVVAVVLASHGDRLVLAWTAPNGRIGLSTSADGSAFSELVRLDEATDAAPAVASFGGRLALAWTRVDAGRSLGLALVRPDAG